MFGVMKSTERKANVFVRFGCFILFGILFQEAKENLRETGTKAQQRILKIGKYHNPFQGTRKLCLGEPFGHTHSCDRTRLGCYTNFLPWALRMLKVWMVERRKKHSGTDSEGC